MPKPGGMTTTGFQMVNQGPFVPLPRHSLPPPAFLWKSSPRSPESSFIPGTICRAVPRGRAAPPMTNAGASVWRLSSSPIRLIMRISLPALSGPGKHLIIRQCSASSQSEQAEPAFIKERTPAGKLRLTSKVSFSCCGKSLARFQSEARNRIFSRITAAKLTLYRIPPSPAANVRPAEKPGTIFPDSSLGLV